MLTPSFSLLCEQLLSQPLVVPKFPWTDSSFPTGKLDPKRLKGAAMKGVDMKKEENMRQVMLKGLGSRHTHKIKAHVH